MSKSVSNLFLELGQVIQINASKNPDIHQHIYLIDYLDNELIKLIDTDDLSKVDLTLRDNKFTDETIENVIVVYQPKLAGYARQNNYIIDQWISIEFGGELPTIINGKITDLEEDMIQITTYPDENIIYIDFEYKGIPKDLPIKSIRPFTPPAVVEEELEEKKSLTPMDEDEDEDLDDEDLDLIVDTEIVKQNIQDIFIDLDEITIEDNDLGEITEQVDISEDQRRYGIESQTNDLLDELLSSVPSNKRTTKVLNNIHILIERFKQLRITFSKFDEQGNAETIIKKGANYKPLVEKLFKLNQKLYWLLPVVKNKHKIYDIDIPEDETVEDVVSLTSSFTTGEEVDIIKQYRMNTVPDGQNKYKFLYSNLDPYFTPFQISNDRENLLDIKSVETNLDVVIENLDDFYSTMVENENLTRRRFVINRYNLGLTHLHNSDPRNKKSKARILPLTANDEIAVKGFLTLTQPYIIYSHINLPTTSILKKVNLHAYNFCYFNILNKATDIEVETIPELKEREVYSGSADLLDKLDSEQLRRYMSKLKAYDFNETVKFLDRNTSETYKTFLETIIPKTRVLFNLIKKYIKNGTSYNKVIEYLEPFLIYHDDITFKQYQTITEFIDKQIDEHKKMLISGVKDFNDYLKTTDSSIVPSTFLKIIKRNHNMELEDIFEKAGYNINDSITTQGSLVKMKKYDCARLLSNAITLSSLDIFQPVDLEAQVAMEQEEIRKELEGETKSNECSPLVLAKRYNDFEELESDNGNSDVLFDEKCDDTPYDIGRAWLQENTDLTSDDKDTINKLSEFLIKNNGVDPQKAERDAESMINGGKLLKNGDYARLDLGDLDYKYYVRENDRWKLDKVLSNKPIDEVSFCNLKQNCLSIKKECSPMDTNKKLIKETLLKEIEKRFEDQLNDSIQQLRKRVEENFRFHQKNIIGLKRYKTRRNAKQSLDKMKIAETLEVRDLIVSPYEDLRDLILGQSDIVKKMNDIILFFEKYTFELGYSGDLEDDDYRWNYCIDTKIKLVPNFLQDLAIAFRQGRYTEELEKIKADRGKISDDGDKWIDKYSGYYICNIEYDSSEGYDKSGYKIISRQVMNIDLEQKISAIKDVRFDYQTELSRQMHTIIQYIDQLLHISLEKQYDFIIKTTTDSLNKFMLPEKRYREMIKRATKQGKKKKPYEKAYDEVLLFSLISSYIIALQTSIPNIETDKTYPACTRSFSGFPIDGNSDFSCLEYITCVLLNTRTNTRPYRVLPKSSKRNREDKIEAYVEKLRKFMAEKVMTFDYVKEKISEKIKYNKINKNRIVIPEEYDLQNWHQFLPPLEAIQVKKLTNINPNVYSTINNHIKSGSYEQFPYIRAIYSKMTSYSFHIIESVQRAINNEPLILTAKSTGLPFTENACCNEGEVKTLAYFASKSPSIIKHNDIIKNLTQRFYFYKNITNAPLFSIPVDTKIKFPQIIKEFSPSTIYLTFIKHCQFNTGVVLDNEMSRICLRNNCDYNQNDSIEEKMEKMRDAGLNYSNSTLNILLNIVNRQNILPVDLDPPIVTEKLHLEKTLNYLKEKDESILCHPKLLDYLLTLVDRFEIEIVEGEEDDAVIDFKQYLNRITNDMSEAIVEKMKEYDSLKNSLENLLVRHIGKNISKKEKFILDFILHGDGSYMSQKDETEYAIFEMLKTFTIDICETYPTIILNKINFKKRYVPKHWKLSAKHENDVMNIMTRDYKDFQQFYGDENLKGVLKYVLKNNKDILMLLKSIPFFAGLLGNEKKTSIFSGEIVKKIGYYFFMCSINLYIMAFDEDVNEYSEKKSEINTDNDFRDMVEDGVDASILKGRREEIEEITCSLINVYLKKIEQYKKILNVDKQTINKRILKSKEKEKSKITLRLKDLTVEEREIENIMKNHSLGDWSVGQTRAIFEYDEKQYDKEREIIEQDALTELKSGIRDEVTEFNRDIYKMEYLEKMAEDHRISAEINDLSVIAEDGEEMGDSTDYM